MAAILATTTFRTKPNSHWQGDFNRSHQCQIMVAAENHGLAYKHLSAL
ncbi:hypothetical protein YSA_03524 [Pseudomonas putida ND6]|uniref:Uncharacterized protein n=1 Tax=Pseudomonas putida ND6 TaxID=231023 RepID=I3UT53_PSEPU|nr:hypothetical protein YSA_03524 [Pseudomonas putida ND6]